MRFDYDASFRFVSRVVIVLCFCAYGCSADPDASGEDRYARRALPIEHRWRRESEIPQRPVKGQRMAIWEVSVHAPGTAPTPEQLRAAEELIERSHEAVLAHRWHDHDKAVADGFYLMPNDRRHFQNDEFLLDDRTLDPNRPEFLMFQSTPEGMALTGLMFLMRSRDERGPQLGGPLTVWHFHRWNRLHCYRDGVIVVGLAQRGKGCLEGVGSPRSPEMLHVWLIDRPGGPFATEMRVDSAMIPGLLAKRKQERGY